VTNTLAYYSAAIITAKKLFSIVPFREGVPSFLESRNNILPDSVHSFFIDDSINEWSHCSSLISHQLEKSFYGSYFKILVWWQSCDIAVANSVYNDQLTCTF
jgi:hypothetical protein